MHFTYYRDLRCIAAPLFTINVFEKENNAINVLCYTLPTCMYACTQLYSVFISARTIGLLIKILSIVLLEHIDGLVRDCNFSIANALKIQQSCTKPSIYASMDCFVALLSQSDNFSVIITELQLHYMPAIYLSHMPTYIRVAIISTLLQTITYQRTLK